MAWFSLAIGVLIFYWLIRKRDQDKTLRYLRSLDKKSNQESGIELGNAINLTSIYKETLLQKLERQVSNTKRQLGAGAGLKLVIFIIVLAFASKYINETFIRGNPWLVLTIIEFAGLYALYMWLQKRELREFEAAFPDALNMLTSAVSSGESLMHAIIYVGNTLDSEVGAEFKLMGERLQMGEAPESVFRKACKRFPYASFQFFVITMNANLQRGGQLKSVMTRLNRLLFDTRAIEKKKLALTSEARASAKIVAAIPFIFLWMLQYLSPENYEYVMTDPSGRYILYYVLASEFIGITIVWRLMKGVEA
ncbi:type II secretion system F family protein [Vibrio fluminensis]|uniref:type II secretion system F family protein n=1 Tax=Vibrio fluminensis TaxID=2783614 RepID=UPI001888EA26|nr:type II secretion system F family protein [Vibrio fluminensis]